MEEVQEGENIRISTTRSGLAAHYLLCFSLGPKNNDGLNVRSTPNQNLGVLDKMKTCSPGNKEIWPGKPSIPLPVISLALLALLDLLVQDAKWYGLLTTYLS